LSYVSLLEVPISVMVQTPLSMSILRSLKARGEIVLCLRTSVRTLTFTYLNDN
jgi:hypothetical protein